MLKICEQKGVGDVYTVDQFYNLSQLAIDDVKQVRELFISKLHKVNKISFWLILSLGEIPYPYFLQINKCSINHNCL